MSRERREPLTDSRPGIGGPRGFGMGGHRGGPPMGIPVEKARDFKGTLKRLAGYLKPRRFQILAVFLMAALSTVFSIVSPKIMGKATTKLFEGLMMKLNHVPGAHVDFQYIWQIILVLTTLYILSAFFGYIQQFIMASAAQKTVYDMRKHIDEKLSRLPLKFFDSRTHGEILSRVTNDVDNIASTLQQSITQLITSLVTIVGIIIMMLTISPLMTLICFVTIPLCLVGTRAIISRSQKYFREQWKELGELNGHVEEMYTGHQIVKAFGHERESINKFNSINERLYEVSWKSQFVSGIIMPLMNFINNIGYVLVCVVGGIFVAKKTMEIGDVQAFIQYSRQFT